jgi:hypothetical protein
VDAFPYITSSNQVDHLQESDLSMERFPDSQPSYLQLYLELKKKLSRASNKEHEITTASEKTNNQMSVTIV